MRFDVLGFWNIEQCVSFAAAGRIHCLMVVTSLTVVTITLAVNFYNLEPILSAIVCFQFGCPSCLLIIYQSKDPFDLVRHLSLFLTGTLSFSDLAVIIHIIYTRNLTILFKKRVCIGSKLFVH